MSANATDEAAVVQESAVAEEAGKADEPTLTDGERLIFGELAKLNVTMEAISNKVVNSTYL